MENVFSSFFQSKEKTGEGKDDNLINFFNSFANLETPSRPSPSFSSPSSSSHRQHHHPRTSSSYQSRNEKLAIQKEFEKEVVLRSKLEYRYDGWGKS